MTDYRIPLMRNIFIDDADTRKALSEFVLTADRLSMATECAAFEQEFATWQGRKYAVLFNSGGSANLALMQALINLRWLSAGENVGFSALTWSTNVMPIIQTGMRPIPIDITPETLNVMIDDLRAALQLNRLHAVFITNALGYLPDLDKIRDLCDQHDTLLLEDNCESLGSALPTGKAGNFGFASTFSFFVAHHMSTIEGGMCCTDDEELADMLRLVRSNGWDRNVSASRQRYWRNQNKVDDFGAAYTFYDLGFNLRPTEITGFLGRLQLRRLEQNITKRQQHYQELESVALTNPDYLPLSHAHQARLSPFAFPVICRTPDVRKATVAAFRREGVEVRPMIAGNIARQPFWRRYQSLQASIARLEGADFVHHHGFYFGIYPDMTREDLALLRGCLCA